jgi:para-nitrobenzyl esterase
MRHPFYPDAAPQSRAIPMMIGNTRDETRGFVGADRALFNLSWEDLPQRLAGAMRVDVLPEAVVRHYRAIYPDYSPSEVYFAATTAARSWRGALIELEERARAGAPAYAYQLDWRAPAEGGIFGAPHTLDIPLVFGNLEASEWIGSRTADAEAMSAHMMDTLLRFARTGDPGWPAYTLEGRATMIFNTSSRVENDPRREEREFFARVPYVQPGSTASRDMIIALKRVSGGSPLSENVRHAPSHAAPSASATHPGTDLSGKLTPREAAMPEIISRIGRAPSSKMK